MKNKYSYSNIGVVIPVREGSSRIKDKVTLPFSDDLNLLEWKIVQLKEIIPLENIYVSTDSEKLQTIALNLGVKIHKRDSYLCKDHIATFSEVITGVVSGIPHDHIAWVTVVVPLMSPIEYKNAFDNYLKFVIDEKTHDSLVAVNLFKEYLWKDGNPLNYQADRNHTISQNLPDIFRVTNGLYMMPKVKILQSGYFLGPNPYQNEVSKMSGIDIDIWEDYEFALAMLNFYKTREKSLDFNLLKSL